MRRTMDFNVETVQQWVLLEDPDGQLFPVPNDPLFLRELKDEKIIEYFESKDIYGALEHVWHFSKQRQDRPC